MNYFAPYSSAQRYSMGRPNFHDNTINRIMEFLRLVNKFNTALDIACGTGLSTQALLNIAAHVYGTDSSEAMLDFALQKDKINYQVATAEEQPFENNFFDLITVCSGVHWFNINKFLSESSRLLKSKSWLILYDNFFLGAMDGYPEFKTWYENVYLPTFPPPARNDNYNWTNETLNEVNFELVHEEIFTNGVSFNKNDLLLYFTSQSNIISAVENNINTYDEVEKWLKKELTPFFNNDDKTEIVHFSNWIKYIKKQN